MMGFRIVNRVGQCTVCPNSTGHMFDAATQETHIRVRVAIYSSIYIFFFVCEEHKGTTTSILLSSPVLYNAK